MALFQNCLLIEMDGDSKMGEDIFRCHDAFTSEVSFFYATCV